MPLALTFSFFKVSGFQQSAHTLWEVMDNSWDAGKVSGFYIGFCVKKEIKN